MAASRHRTLNLFTVIILRLLFLHCVIANWWQLGFQYPTSNSGSSATEVHKDNCQRLEYLVERQRDICLENEKILPIIGKGAKLGIEECQYQFRHSRWNCSISTEGKSLFGNVTTIRSRETAYLYAISAASVAFSVTRACSRGELNECGCDNRVRHRRPRAWQWGGCSEDIHFGEDFSRKWVDSTETTTTGDGLMNLRNNEAGRRSIRSKMQRVCKCHGMSGSCSMRVCWRRLPPFRAVGESLYSRYEGASHMRFVDKGPGRIKKLRASPDFKKPTKSDLVYLDDSPDYCERNETLNILGTRGRTCNRTSPGLDGCRLLCCGRGYQTRVREVEEKCRCRFVWCCNVVCDVCRYRKEEHVCN